MRVKVLAARPSRSALMIGMPPATAASKARPAPFVSASCASALPCRAISAADQLDDDVDVGIRGHRHGVGEPARAGELDAAVTPAVARRDGGESDLAPAALRDEAGVLAKQVDDAGADGAETG